MVTLGEAGFANIDLELVVAHNRIVGDQSFLKSEGSGIPAQLVKDGFLSRDVVDRLSIGWHKALQRPDHSFVRQLYVAVGEKSAAEKWSDDLGHEPHQAKGRADLGTVVTLTEPSDNPVLVQCYLRDRIAELLAIPSNDVPMDRPLIDLGMDSISAVDLVDLVAGKFSHTLAPSDILEAQSIDALAAKLQAELATSASIQAKASKTEWIEGEL